MNSRDTSPAPAGISHIGEKIKQVRKTNKLTQKSFASSLGIAQGFLCAIEKGRKKPSTTLLIALQHTYNVDSQWLYDGGETAYNHPLLPGDRVETPLTGIPLLHSVNSGGHGADTRANMERIALPGLEKNCFAIIYSGDFMSPTIRDGDIVIINPDEEPAQGRIVLIIGKWEEPFLRRQRSKGGETYYTADNTAYAPFKPDESTRVIGVVASVWRKINI